MEWSIIAKREKDRIPLARHKRTNSYLQKGIKMHSVWSQNKRIKTIRAPFPQLTSLRAEQPNDRSHDYTQCRMNAWAHWVVAREPTIIGIALVLPTKSVFKY
jgi:hypothetical protein